MQCYNTLLDLNLDEIQHKLLFYCLQIYAIIRWLLIEFRTNLQASVKCLNAFELDALRLLSGLNRILLNKAFGSKKWSSVL